jgi:DNA polymerase-1
MIVLIDATSLASKIFHIMENDFKEHKFFNLFISKIYDSISFLKASHCLVVFNDYEESNRKSNDENYTYSPANHEIMNRLIQNISEGLNKKGISCYSKKGCESRDIIASIHFKLTQKNIPITIISQEKTILSLVNSFTRIYDPMARNDSKKFINKELFISKYMFSPDKMIDFLLLSGIKKYGISGITGVGEKKAIVLIDDYGSVESLLEHSQEVEGTLGKNLRNELKELIYNFKNFVELDKNIELGLSLNKIKYMHNYSR